MFRRTRQQERLNLSYDEWGARAAALPSLNEERTPAGFAGTAVAIGRYTAELTFLCVEKTWKLALVAGLLSGGAWGAHFGYNAVLDAPFFSIAEVKVGGAPEDLADEIDSVVAGHKTASLLRLDALQLEERLEANPRIAEATVTKIHPDTLTVAVSPRVPVAILATDPMYLMDREGVAIREVETNLLPQVAALPFLTGFSGEDAALGAPTDSREMRDLLTLQRILKQANRLLEEEVVEYHVAELDEGLELVFNSGARVKVGRSLPQARELAVLEALFERTNGLHGLDRVDLRFGGQVVLSDSGLGDSGLGENAVGASQKF